MPWDVDEVAINLFNRGGMKWVLLEGDTPVCAAGVSHVVNGVWESWMVGTMSNWDKYWRSITKYTRRIINEILKVEATRVQIYVLATRSKTCEWYIRGLKMKFEGRMHGFGANE